MVNKVFLLLFLVSVNLFPQSDSEQIKMEASLKVFSFLNLIPEGRESDYGFDNRSDFSKIKIENPYQIYYVTFKNNKLMFITSNQWRVPLSIEKKFVALLTVQIVKGKPTVVDFGGNKLAQKIQEFEDLYSNEIGKYVVIRNTFLKRDYITSKLLISHNQNVNSDSIEVNIDSMEPMYEINSMKPTKTSIANFYNETIGAIKENKY